MRLSEQEVIERLRDPKHGIQNVLDWLIEDKRCMVVVAGGSIVRKDFSQDSDIDLFAAYEDEIFRKVLETFKKEIASRVSTDFSYFDGHYPHFGYSHTFVLSHGKSVDIAIAPVSEICSLGLMNSNVFLKDTAQLRGKDYPQNYTERNLKYYNDNVVGIANEWLFQFAKLIPELSKNDLWASIYHFSLLRNLSLQLLRARESIPSPIVAKPEKRIGIELSKFLPTSEILLPNTIPEVKKSVVVLYSLIAGYIKTLNIGPNIKYLEKLECRLEKYVKEDK